jgi:hypothetical protein
MILEAKTAILNSGDFLPANEVAKLAGVSAVNPTLQPNKWKRDQDIFAIRHHSRKRRARVRPRTRDCIVPSFDSLCHRHIRHTGCEVSQCQSGEFG